MYLHPFIKWKAVIGQKAEDLKSGKYMLNEEDQRTVNLLHKELSETMVLIQKSTLDNVRFILVFLHGKKVFNIKSMMPNEKYLYSRIIDYSRGKSKSISDDDLIKFRNLSWATYSKISVETMPYFGKRGGLKHKK